MATADCLSAIRNAAGDLSDDEILEIAEAIQRRRNRLSAEGRLDNLDARLAQAAKEEGDKARIAAALVRKHAALNAIVRDKLHAQIEGHIAAGLDPRKAVLAVLEGTTRGVARGRESVSAFRMAFEARFIGQMLGEIERARPHLVGLLDDARLQADTVREMFELRDGGQPGKTGNDDARFLADTFAAFADRSRTDLNRLGAAIGKLDGWAGPQKHDAYKLLQAGRDKWVADTFAALDLARTFPDLLTDAGAPDAAAIRDVLADIWTTITTGRDNTISAREKGEFVGPRNLARSLARHRVLHFRDPDAWLDYHAAYGHGGLFANLLEHQRRAAKLAAQMQVLGPNPKVMLDSVLESLQRRVRNDPAIPAAAKDGIIRSLTSEGHGGIGSAYAEMSGLTATPADVSAARIASAIRRGGDMAKLGAMVFSAIPSDAVTGAANLRFNGKPLFQAYRDLLAEFLKGRGKGVAREIGYLIGEGFDGLIGHVNSAYAADGAPGLMSRLTATFLRWSGAAWQTDAMRAANARILSSWLGEHTGQAWGALPAELRHVFGLHGIDEARWEAIRQAPLRTAGVSPASSAMPPEAAGNGRTYLTPDAARALPDHVIDELIADDILALGETGRRGRARPPGAPPPSEDFTVPGAPRPAWGEGFPDVVVQHPWGSRTRSQVRASPDYAAAKAGDLDAAERVVVQLVRPEKVDQLRAQIGGEDAVLVPVIAREAAGKNKLPLVYAHELEQALGLKVTADIVQATKAGHTGAAAAERIVRRAEFDGPVEPGRAYVLVDDHVTLGGTLADLRAYIESKGGRVIAATSLSASAGSHRLALPAERLAALRNKLGDAEAWFKERFGHGYEGLTNAEAGQLLKYGSADGLRSGLAAARSAGGPGDVAATRAGDGETGGEAGGLAEDDPRLARLREQARLDLELSLARYFADEVSFGHIETDEASRRLTPQGTQPGTALGEAMRFVTHFKSFPMAFGNRVLGRAFYGADPRATSSERLLNGAAHIGHLIAALAIAGYMSMTAKDLLRGWEPRQPHDFRSWMKVIGASLAQGGGAGIWGDFLFGEANRFGGGARRDLTRRMVPG
jgi:hypothetical protein